MNQIPIGTTLAGSSTLVTGATGFLGAHLVRALQARGTDVFGQSRRDQSDGPSDMRWLQADLTDLEQVRHTFAQCKPDHVFHLSSLADGRLDLALVIPILQAELVATVNVLTVAAEQGVRRLIIAGSLEEPVAGDVPSSPYGAAKAASRLYARMFHLLYQVPAVTARIFMAYGPGQPSWKLIPSVAATLRRGMQPRIGSADREADWIFVSDVIDGLLRLCEAGAVEGETIDIGSGKLVTIREVVEMLCELTESRIEPEFSRSPERRFERVANADVAAAERVLGWKAGVPLREGLERTIAAIRPGDTAR